MSAAPSTAAPAAAESACASRSMTLTARLPRLRWMHGVEGLALLLLAVVMTVSAALHPLISDEGVTLTGAWRLGLGDRLYVDFFEYVAPASFYVLHGLWQLFGQAGYASARLLSCAMLLLAAGFLYAGAARISPHRPSYWGPCLFVLFMNYGPLVNHNTFFVLPASAALYFGLVYLKDLRGRQIVWAGVATGMSVLFLQHKGLALALPLATGLAVVAWRRRGFRRAALHTSLFGAGLLGPLACLLHWDLGLLYDALIRFPAENYLAVQQSTYAHLGAFLLLAVLAFASIRRLVAVEAQRWLIGLQAALMLTTFQGVDIFHLAAVSMPTVVALSVGLGWPDRASGGEQAGIGRAWFRGLAIVSLTPIAVLLFSVWVLVVQRQSAARLELVQAIQQACEPGTALYAGAFTPGLYFEARRASVTRYSVLLERLNTPAQFDEAAADIARAPKVCAAFNLTVARKFGHTGRNPVEQMIATQFRRVRVVRNTELSIRP